MGTVNMVKEKGSDRGAEQRANTRRFKISTIVLCGLLATWVSLVSWNRHCSFLSRQKRRQEHAAFEEQQQSDWEAKTLQRSLDQIAAQPGGFLCRRLVSIAAPLVFDPDAPPLEFEPIQHYQYYAAQIMICNNDQAVIIETEDRIQNHLLGIAYEDRGDGRRDDLWETEDIHCLGQRSRWFRSRIDECDVESNGNYQPIPEPGRPTSLPPPLQQLKTLEAGYLKRAQARVAKARQPGEAFLCRRVMSDLASGHVFQYLAAEVKTCNGQRTIVHANDCVNCCMPETDEIVIPPEVLEWECQFYIRPTFECDENSNGTYTPVVITGPGPVIRKDLKSEADAAVSDGPVEAK